MKNQFVLQASASSIKGITKMIREFYCGSESEIRPDGENRFSVHRKDGTKLSTYVIVKKGRYRFGFDMPA